MTHYDKLRSYGPDELADYLWKRLRLEELDPPIDHPLVMDSPEGLIIRALKESEDPSFRERLIEAVKKNAADLSIRSATQPLDAIANEQLASLAFLAAAIDSGDLCAPLYRLASGFLIAPPNETAVSSRTLFHLVRSVARLQEGTYLVPFWHDLWGHENPILREIAYYGLSRADTEQAMQMLRDVVGDRDIDLSAVAWSLATESPGAETLGREVATLPIEMRREFRDALVDASAGDSTFKAVQDFDRYVALGEVEENRKKLRSSMPTRLTPKTSMSRTRVRRNHQSVVPLGANRIGMRSRREANDLSSRNELISLLRQPTDSWLQYYDIYWHLVERFCDDQGTNNPSLTTWWNSELRPLRRQLRSCSEQTMRAIVIHTMTALEIYLKSIGEERSAYQMKESKRRMLARKAGRVFSARFPPTLAFLPPELLRLPRSGNLSPFLKTL